jgi:quinol-cytochrome oxidoreductase complex cytochrome b subunit
MGKRIKARTAEAAAELDQRMHLAAGLRRQINKVFPTHRSFLLGEIALYSFIVLVLSGIYLALYFDPSMVKVRYDGSASPANPYRDSYTDQTHQIKPRRSKPPAEAGVTSTGAVGGKSCQL